jgi:wyosine [tRNA(Phe)-imidazoG37] synthetase (radical SAM superfamily)
MTKRKYKYIYGPVPSWRLGSSLGVDPIQGREKICTFDCLYCQLGKTAVFTDKRKKFVPTSEVMKEINSLPPLKIDYITFSGMGEPTLARNLGEMIRAVKKARKEKIAVLTNASLMCRKDVRKDLLKADLVAVKMDASSGKLLRKVNRPMKGITLERIVRSIKEFKTAYRGKLALQIMFIKENEKYAKEIAKIAKEISPDEVQINTPLRPCDVKPLARNKISRIKKYFQPLNVVSVYESRRKKVRPISTEETLRRRGKV